jgi:hypothetical protein
VARTGRELRVRVRVRLDGVLGEKDEEELGSAVAEGDEGRR